jgi:hypothetical protein
MKKNHKILGVFLFVLLCIPALHHILGLKDINPLKGAYILTPLPDLSYRSWNKQDYQQKFEKYIEDNIGFRPQIVKLTNQINYSLFKELNPQGIIIGEENYLYEAPYILSKAGKDFIGSDSLNQISKNIKSLQKELNKIKTKLLVILAPDKVTFYPEYLPKKYRDRTPTDSTNFKVFSNLLIQDSINHIDFNRLFLRWKDTSKYPLFPKYGTHWSSYGWTLAADTIIKKLEGISSQKYNQISIKNIELTENLRDTDYDIGECLNLLFKLPSHSMAYPSLVFDSIYKKPKVLVLGDSYYVNIAKSTIPGGVFQTHDFLYYNERLYGDENKEINLPSDFMNYDFVIIEATTANIRMLCYGLFSNNEIKKMDTKKE